MLELRPNCECCNKDLPPDDGGAMICSFECTFCSDCASTRLKGICPNCGGELLARPRRPADKLAKYPASSTPVFKPEGSPFWRSRPRWLPAPRCMLYI